MLPCAILWANKKVAARWSNSPAYSRYKINVIFTLLLSFSPLIQYNKSPWLTSSCSFEHLNNFYNEKLLYLFHQRNMTYSFGFYLIKPSSIIFFKTHILNTIWKNKIGWCQLKDTSCFQNFNIDLLHQREVGILWWTCLWPLVATRTHHNNLKFVSNQFIVFLILFWIVISTMLPSFYTLLNLQYWVYKIWNDGKIYKCSMKLKGNIFSQKT